jgi:hypothetical protein
MDSYAKKSSVLGLIINGTFYCPAFKHYGETPLNVECSVCGKSNLVSAIGYGSQDNQAGSYDFCLECVDKITNSFNFNSKKNSNQNQNKFSSNVNNFEMFSSNSNNILASNDFSNGGSSWEDQFMSSLNPTTSGIHKSKFNYEGFTNNNPNSLNNPNSSNNQNGPNYLENFFQPLNPNGFKRR